MYSTLWTLYRSYFNGIRANIEQPLYIVTCCRPYKTCTFITSSMCSVETSEILFMEKNDSTLTVLRGIYVELNTC
jgi:hypothetical protein